MPTGTGIRALDRPSGKARTQVPTRHRPRPNAITGPLTRDGLLDVQRTAGNRATLELVRRRREQQPVPVQRVKPIRDDYSNLNVTSVAAEISGTGAFVGDSRRQFEETKAHLHKRKRPAEEVDVRIEMLKGKVIEAWRRMKLEEGTMFAEALQARNGGNPRVLGVFSAPEWFFKRPYKPFTEEDKDKIAQAFVELSDEYPDMTIVPGTIVWSKGTGSGKWKKVGDDTKLFNTAMVFMNGRVLKEIHKKGEGYDIVGYHPDAQDPNTKGLPKRSSVLDAFNRGGKGEGESSYFDVGNLRFALEICADHDSARARNEVEAAKDGPSTGVDVQLLISNGSTRRGGDVTRPGGYFIQNDAQEGKKKRSVVENIGTVNPISQTSNVRTVGAAGTAGDQNVPGRALPLTPRTPAGRITRLGGQVAKLVNVVKGGRQNLVGRLDAGYESRVKMATDGLARLEHPADATETPAKEKRPEAAGGERDKLQKQLADLRNEEKLVNARAAELSGFVDRGDQLLARLATLTADGAADLADAANALALDVVKWASTLEGNLSSCISALQLTMLSRAMLELKAAGFTSGGASRGLVLASAN